MTRESLMSLEKSKSLTWLELAKKNKNFQKRSEHNKVRVTTVCTIYLWSLTNNFIYISHVNSSITVNNLWFSVIFKHSHFQSFSTHTYTQLMIHIHKYKYVPSLMHVNTHSNRCHYYIWVIITTVDVRWIWVKMIGK